MEKHSLRFNVLFKHLRRVLTVFHRKHCTLLLTIGALFLYLVFLVKHLIDYLFNHFHKCLLRSPLGQITGDGILKMNLLHRSNSDIFTSFSLICGQHTMIFTHARRPLPSFQIRKVAVGQRLAQSG